MTIPLFLLALLLAFSDFLVFGQLLSSVEGVRLILVVGEFCVRTFLVFGAFILMTEAHKVPNLSVRGWLKYASVTTAICAIPPLTLSTFLRNYLLFTAFQRLGGLLSHLPTPLSGFLLLSLHPLVLEFPRLLLTQRIWQALLAKAGQKPSGTQDGKNKQITK